MKRLFGTILFALMLMSVLTSCLMPSPAIQSGKFNFSVTYEQNGELKTFSAIYACSYAGTSWSMEGNAYRAWEGHFEGNYENDSVKLCTTDDGGTILLVFLNYPEYFMGEPDYVNAEPVARLALVYYSEEDGSEIDMTEDVAVIAEHGVRIVDFVYDEPIVNTFG